MTMEGGLRGVFETLPKNDPLDGYAEVAAHRASVLLGFPFVPPTVLRIINGVEGSLQLFIDTKIDLLSENNYDKFLEKFGKKDLEKLKIFYFVLGQWDSGAHNLLAYEHNSKLYPIAIDNSGIRNHQKVRYGELPFVRVLYSEKFNSNDWDKEFPFDQARVLDTKEASLRNEFGQKVPETFYKNFSHDRRVIKFVIYRNGLWVQYHPFDETFVKSYVEECSPDILEALQKLDLISLRQIFGDRASEFDLVGIIDRKKQVLDFCHK